MASKSSEGSSWVLYAAVGSFVVVGVGIAAYLLSKEDDPIVQQFKTLGTAKLIKVTTEEGEEVEIFDFEYFNSLMKIIKTSLLKVESSSKDEYLQKRLELYKAEAWEKYEQLIKDNYVKTQHDVAKVISLAC